MFPIMKRLIITTFTQFKFSKFKKADKYVWIS